MDGISNMRVHASFNYSNANYAIRLSDIYVVKVLSNRFTLYYDYFHLLFSAVRGLV